MGWKELRRKKLDELGDKNWVENRLENYNVCKNLIELFLKSLKLIKVKLQLLPDYNANT